MFTYLCDMFTFFCTPTPTCVYFCYELYVYILISVKKKKTEDVFKHIYALTKHTHMHNNISIHI